MTNAETSPNLSSLLLRVEGATGADREIDALIIAALFAPPGSYVEQSKLNGAWCIFDGVDRSGRPRLWEKRGLPRRPDGWPVTASLDAALALCERVLPGWLRSLIERNDTQTERSWLAAIYPLDGAQSYGARHKTPALAILCAMLKALIAASEDGTTDRPSLPREEQP